MSDSKAIVLSHPGTSFITTADMKEASEAFLKELHSGSHDMANIRKNEKGEWEVLEYFKAGEYVFDKPC